MRRCEYVRMRRCEDKKMIGRPEKRGQKPGSSLNGDRRVESMEGSAAGGWWGHRGRSGGAGGVRLCWVWARGALGEGRNV